MSGVVTNTPNYEKEPDYNVFLEVLIQKTREGKLSWQETAREGTFIAAVKGQHVFEVSKGLAWSEEGEYSFAAVTAKDSTGKVLFHTPEQFSDLACRLYELAERIGKRVDERLQTTVELLSRL